VNTRKDFHPGDIQAMLPRCPACGDLVTYFHWGIETTEDSSLIMAFKCGLKLGTRVETDGISWTVKAGCKTAAEVVMLREWGPPDGEQQAEG
jgi:hypothetical protein